MSATHTAPTHSAPAPPAQRAARRRLDRGPSAWLRDVRLGVRLAVGGGRTSLLRLVFTTVGIGLAAAVLLVAACVPHLITRYHQREAAVAVVTAQRAGVSPLYYLDYSTQYQQQTITGVYVRASGANSPVPPGVSRLPGPNQIVLSPALAALLNSPDGANLRARFPQQVIGTIADTGLTQPAALTFYAGAPDTLDSADGVQRVYAFGVPPSSGLGTIAADAVLLAVLAMGAVVLLLPILVFVSVSSRIAGAQRDRRLAALRLVGAGARQTKRIAAAETLVGAATGLVFGVLVFLLLRQALGGADLLNFSVFTADIVPSWPLAVVAVLVVPVISVGTALVALRRTLIEPLGVFRESKPVRRRLWWRLLLVVVGVVPLVLLGRANNSNIFQMVFGVTVLLVSLPAILPWLLERTAGLFRGGPVSWQLAVRRLQLDSGTPARVVGGVAVVLAGAIALQTALFATTAQVQTDSANIQDLITGDNGRQVGIVEVTSDGAIADQVTAALRHTSVVSGVDQYFQLNAVLGTPVRMKYNDDNVSGTEDIDTVEFGVADCAQIQRWITVSDCQDGQLFAPSPSPDSGVSIPAPAPGTKVMFTNDTGYESDTRNAVNLGTWTMPSGVRPAVSTAVGRQINLPTVLLTPGALHNATQLSTADSVYAAQVDPNNSYAPDEISNALAPFLWRTQSYALYVQANSVGEDKVLTEVRTGLVIGSLFTLALAGASLLVLALEQIRERRRPLAALAAAGVPRSVLARSLLWQNAMPVVVATLVAIVVGVGLAALVLRATRLPMMFDWSDIALFSGVAIALVVLVTALTLPSLRGATKLAAMRTE